MNTLTLTKQGDYFDFCIDGTSLQQILYGSMPPDNTFATFLCERLSSEVRQKEVGVLLGAQPTLDTGRAELYLCPECFDPSDGVISAQITCNDTTVRWTNLGHEDLDSWEEIEGSEAYIFDRKEYERAIRTALAKLEVGSVFRQDEV